MRMCCSITGPVVPIYGNMSIAFILKCAWPFLDPCSLQIKVTCFVEMSETTCLVVQWHNPEDWNFQWHHCQNLKNCMWCILLPLCYKGSKWAFPRKGMLRETWATLERLGVNICSTAFTPEMTVIKICLQEGKEMKCSYCRLLAYDTV
jgi:hypothetical protein